MIIGNKLRTSYLYNGNPIPEKKNVFILKQGPVVFYKTSYTDFHVVWWAGQKKISITLTWYERHCVRNQRLRWFEATLYTGIWSGSFSGLRCILQVYSWWRHQIETFSGEFPAQSQWREALVFSLIWAWINGWVNNHEAGDLRRHRAHYDVTVMFLRKDAACWQIMVLQIQHPKPNIWFGVLNATAIIFVSHYYWLEISGIIHCVPVVQSFVGN